MSVALWVAGCSLRTPCGWFGERAAGWWGLPARIWSSHCRGCSAVILGPDAAGLPVVEDSWPSYEHVNVQTALDMWLAEPGVEHELVGVIGFQHRQFGLAELLATGAGQDPYGPRPGNVARVNVATGPDGRVLACVQCAVYLVADGLHRVALLIREADPSSGQPLVTVQVVSSDRTTPARRQSGCASWRWRTTCSGGRCCRSAARCSDTARRCCSSTGAQN